MDCATRRWVIVPAMAALIFLGCERGQKRLRESPPSGSLPLGVRQVELQPGTNLVPRDITNPYEGNAHAIAEGRELYEWFNCIGCHFNGGGGMGPPFIDDDWIYGGEPANIFASIIEGRANGMPAYGGKIPEYQAWLLAAYVSALAETGGEAETPGMRGDPLAEERTGHRRR